VAGDDAKGQPIGDFADNQFGDTVFGAATETASMIGGGFSLCDSAKADRSDLDSIFADFNHLHVMSPKKFGRNLGGACYSLSSGTRTS
jgi:hypothetical protein